jgi:hypothetical protein
MQEGLKFNEVGCVTEGPYKGCMERIIYSGYLSYLEYNEASADITPADMTMVKLWEREWSYVTYIDADEVSCDYDDVTDKYCDSCVRVLASPVPERKYSMSYDIEYVDVRHDWFKDDATVAHARFRTEDGIEFVLELTAYLDSPKYDTWRICADNIMFLTKPGFIEHEPDTEGVWSDIEAWTSGIVWRLISQAKDVCCQDLLSATITCLALNSAIGTQAKGEYL